MTWPDGYCDAVTGAALFALALTFWYLLASRRRDPFSWMLGLLGVFLLLGALRFTLEAVSEPRGSALHAALAVLLAAMAVAAVATLLRLLPAIVRTPSPLVDALTRLPNRAMIEAHVAREFERAARNPRAAFAVIFVDLDGFKAVNDALGHDAGDELLVAVAGRLRDGLRAGDVVARLGGDEFLVYMDRVNDRAVAERGAARILAELAKPYRVKGSGATVGASAGVAFSRDYTDVRLLLRDADAAMYAAKARGGGRYQVA